MHESIARATYKGFARKLQNRTFDISRALCGTTRAAWLRSLIKSEARDVRSVLLEPPRITGEGKRAKLYMFGVTYVDDDEVRNTGPFWVGYSIRAEAKTFDLDCRYVPVLVTNHLVQRTMQRLGIEDPPTALCNLRTAIMAAMVLGPPGDRQALLPIDGGVVIAVQDKEWPEFWALITFVDEAKLRPEQIREANRWSERTADCWAEMETAVLKEREAANRKTPTAQAA